MRAILALLGIILIVIWLQLGFIIQGPQILVIQLICLAIFILLCVGLYFLIVWAFRRYTLKNTPSGRMTGDRPSRRSSADLRKTDEETRLEALDDNELKRLIAQHPRYALAVEVLCERLKAHSQWGEYARQMQYMLSIPNDLSTEEVCNHYYELADIYHNRLGRVERAEEMIRAIIAAYPNHYQATEARRRLAELHRLTSDAINND